MGATALLGIGAHFINTLADREDDARSGIAGLPAADERRGPACFTGVGPAVRLRRRHLVARWRLRGRPHHPAPGVCLAAATMVVVTTLRDAPRAAWTWTLVTVLGCLVLFAVARPSSSTRLIIREHLTVRQPQVANAPRSTLHTGDGGWRIMRDPG